MTLTLVRPLDDGAGAGGYDATADRHYTPSLTEETVAAVVRHRMMTTKQLHELLSPDSTPAATRKRCQRNVARGLLHPVGTRHDRVWMATEQGVDLITSEHERRYVGDGSSYSRALTAHTLAVNEIGLAFVRAARLLGHECDSRSWEHEVAHSISANKKAQRVISDALLTYGIPSRSALNLRQWFIEMDRCTEPVNTLHLKLRRYAEYRSYRPTGPNTATAGTDPYWERRYPTFPGICVVIGANAHKTANEIDNRIRSVCALVADDDVIRRQRLNIAFARFSDLRTFGAHKPLWWTPRHNDPIELFTH